MPAKRLHDPVPLGVSGLVTIPLERYIARVGSKPDRAAVLLDENERIAYVARRLLDALGRPLTSPGSEGLARSVFGCFKGVDLLPYFAEKLMETLRDGGSHNRTAISPDRRAAVLFVAWNGTHREVQSQRFGNYLKPLVATARRFVERGIQLAGLLEIDAYVRDNPDGDEPGRPLDEVFEVDVEYSYLPGDLVGSSSKADALLPDILVLNPDLCDPEETQLLRKFMARSS